MASGQHVRRGQSDKLRHLGSSEDSCPMGIGVRRSAAGQAPLLGTETWTCHHVKALRVSGTPGIAETAKAVQEKRTWTDLWGPTSGEQAGAGAETCPPALGSGFPVPPSPLWAEFALLSVFEPRAEISGFDPYFNLDLFSLRNYLD